MANKVANVDDVTEAMGGVALADRTTPLAPSWLPALRGMGEMSTRAVRSHLHRPPDRVHEATPIVPEEPLIETDAAPGFSSVRQVAVGRGPIVDMCVDRVSGRLFVANLVDGSVCALDPDTFTVTTTVHDLDEPSGIAAVSGRAYVSTATATYDAITVVDSTTGAHTVHPLASSARAIAPSPDGRHVFVARSGRDGADAAVVDTADGRVTTIDLGTRCGATAEAIAVSDDGTRVYVVTADHLGGELVVIDTDTCRVVGALWFEATPRDVAVSADGNTLFVASFDPTFGGIVDVIDSGSLRVVGSTDLGGAITGLLLSATGARLYVVNSDRVTVICTRTWEIVDTITVVTEPSCIAESADGRRLFIADHDGVVTSLTVASSTESLLAKMMASEVIDVPMLELDRAAV